MRNSYWILVAVVLYACTGSLTDEQRKKLRENMEAGEIRKVSDAEMLEASFAYGRTITSIIEKRDRTLTDQRLLDSLQQAFHVRIVSLTPGDSMALEIENQIIDAYTSGAGQVSLADNIQKLGADSMLYTKPILRDLPDGTVEFVRALGIHMPKKHIVLSIQEK